MHLPNLYTTPTRHVIKIRTFLKKNKFFKENTCSGGVLKDLNSSKSLQVLKNNKTPAHTYF